MKHCILSALACMVLCFVFASCGDEDEKFRSIDFKTTGVALSPLSANRYAGEVGLRGGEITLTATGKNAGSGFLSQVVAGDSIYEVTDSDRMLPLPHTVCDASWGKVEIVSASPYTTRVVLYANPTSHARNCELKFGGAYTTSSVLLTQSGE